MDFISRRLILSSLFILFFAHSRAQKAGDTLPQWTEGFMDIHHINTGRGNATFFILPDGTTLLIDAGALDPTSPRVLSARNTPAAPGPEKQPGEWIARYISKFMTMSKLTPKLDYAQITHFHDDHFGSPYPGARKSEGGNFVLTGITEVASFLPIQKMIDRAWPDYNYPKAVDHPVINNYISFVKWQAKNKGTIFERSMPGRNDQIVLVKNKIKYAQNFEVRNIIANGELWTGLGTNTRQLFPEISTLQPAHYPSENMCSIGVRISYGKFDYFSGGDMPGVLHFGSPIWNDVETPVSKIVGPVDAHILDHHGNRDSQNETLLASLRPRILIIPVWSSDHPGHDVLDRIYSQQIYTGERDVFASSMLEANKLVIGDMLNKLKSDKGHIVLRIEPGGENYKVIILEDNNENFNVKSVFGPYAAR